MTNHNPDRQDNINDQSESRSTKITNHKTNRQDNTISIIFHCIVLSIWIMIGLKLTNGQSQSRHTTPITNHNPYRLTNEQMLFNYIQVLWTTQSFVSWLPRELLFLIYIHCKICSSELLVHMIVTYTVVDIECQVLKFVMISPQKTWPPIAIFFSLADVLLKSSQKLQVHV